MAVPAIYFVDGKVGAIDMIQGEITAEQIYPNSQEAVVSDTGYGGPTAIPWRGC